MSLNKETKPNQAKAQIDLFENYLHSIGLCAIRKKKLLRNNYTKKCEYEHRMNEIH